MQKKIILVCEECSARNYTMKKNSNNTERVELLKFCKHCNKRTLHKESK